MGGSRLKEKTIVIFLIIVILIIFLAIYIITIFNPLEKDIVYEFRNENWYAKIVIDYDPQKYSNTDCYTMEYYYLRYFGDNEVFKENKPIKYKLAIFDYRYISGESTSMSVPYIDGSGTYGYMLDVYPNIATLEINIDGQVETYELLRQGKIK